MQCPQCQHENLAGQKLCGECGARLTSACPSCGTSNPPTQKFCGECGTGLAQTDGTAKYGTPQSYTPKHLADKILTSRAALEGERKQVTVLFCDLVGSTALAERLGPERMHALLNQFFGLVLAEVHRYEGTINQFLGDGFMALFGAPLAHEDHARRGVLAALGIRRALREGHAELAQPDARELAIRMGLNTGAVVVGKIGDNLRMDYTAVGDTTNLAARLQQLAEPGAILVSDATRQLVRGDVRLDALAPVLVKGKTESITPYSVSGLWTRRSPLDARENRTLSLFVGRERELAALHELIAQVELGQGQVVGVVGEPGVGKSRLLHELRRGLAGRQVTLLEGRCLSYGSSIPYSPVLDIVRSNCGIADTDTPEAIADKARVALQEVGMDAEAATPYLLQLLGVKEGTAGLAVMTPEAIKTRIFETLTQMCLRGSRRRLLVLVIEDLHWVDATSEEFLASLIERLPGASILIVSSYRPGYQPQWIVKSYATQFALRPLSTTDSLSVIYSVIRREQFPDQLAQAILEKADGNPFFLEELALVVVEHGDLRSGVEVPDTIQAVLTARIDRLPDVPKRLLQTASVLGREFSLRLLEAVWDGIGGVDTALRELKRLEFLYERSGVDEGLHLFKHALTQEVAYASLLTPRREALHAAAGQALESLYADRLEQVYDRLAHHYSKTTEASKAVRYLTRFAERAARAHAHVEAATALRTALVHVEQLAAWERDRCCLDLVLRQAESLHYLGGRQAIVDLLLQHQDRLERLEDPAVAGPFYFRLGWTYGWLGDREQAGHNVMRAFAAGMECGDRLTMGKASILVALERAWSGQPAESVALGQRAIAFLEQTDEQWWLGYAYYTLSGSYIANEEYEKALEAAAQVDAISEVISDRRLQTNACQVTGMVHTISGEWDAAIEVLQRGLEHSPDPFETAVILGFLGDAHVGKGDLAQAIPVLERAVQQANQYRSRQVQSWFGWFLARAYLGDGQLEKAHDRVTEALALATDTKFHHIVGGAQWVLGCIAQAQGNLAEADTRLREALQTASSIPSRIWTAHVHLVLAGLADAQGDREAVSAHLTEAHSLFNTVKVSRWVERTEQIARDLRVHIGGEI